MQKNVGIITHYYHSENYGGLLQSYALCKYLNDNGVKAKQVCYDASVKHYTLQNKLRLFAYNCRSFVKNTAHYASNAKIKKRKKNVVSFREQIPHTETVYNYKNISEANSLFDAFVTGSDQVWHPAVINEAYLLSFTDKPRFSYAASVACDSIPEEKKQLYKVLESYSAVSVRERTAMELLPVSSELVLDPVFLLPQNEWVQVASKRLIKESYAFCYFLGGSVQAREDCAAFAKKTGLKLVNIPYLKGIYRKCDDGFGDYSLCDVSPNDYLSLILHADYIFTDSFHAICFSYIFKKQFFVFNRKTKANSGTRINDILFTLDLENRCCGDSFNDAVIDNPINYDEPRPVFEELQQSSLRFINSMIKGLTNE